MSARPAPRLSYSRIDRWEKCPLSYRFRYHDRLEGEVSAAPELGKAVHAAIEALEREHVQEERRCALSRERATYHWQQAFKNAGLAGADVFQEGLELVLGFVREQGELDAHDVIAIEEPFELRIGAHTVIGLIDRVDRVDDEVINVIDFKTSRLLFTHDELDTNLQLSLYQLAAQELWPWAKAIRLTMWMLRHNVRQATIRSPEQLEGARAYVQVIGDQLASATEFPARPNTLCGFCEFRRSCPAYADLLKGKHEHTAESLDDLEQVAREREDVAAIAKAAYKRKDELDRVLKAHLSERGALVLAGVRYGTFRVTSTEYPLDRTAAILARATGRSEDDVRAEIATVSNGAVQALLKKLGKFRRRAEVELIKSELEAFATRTHSERLWGKPLKEVRA